MAWSKKLPSGKWQAKYRDRDGKERSAGSFPHKRAADNAAAAAEYEARSLGWRNPDAAARTWGEWCEEWWPTRSAEPSTLDAECSIRDHHLLPRWGQVPLIEITRQEGRRWISELASVERTPSPAELKRRKDPNYQPIKKLLSAASIGRIFGLFSTSLSAAVDAEIIPSNPIFRLKMPRRPPATERYLTKAEVDLIEEVMVSPLDRAILALLVGTGLRWGEAMGLHRHRVDFKRGLIHVVETFDRSTGEIKAYPKGKLAREVPLPGWVAEAILNVGTPESRSCGIRHRGAACRSNLLLHDGAVTDVNNWRKRSWSPALTAAGVEHTRIHDLRHTYASWLLQDGISLEEVASLLGHASTAVTTRYAHLGAVPSQRVLAAMNRAANVPQTGVNID